jgi:hypothetical protein
MKHSTFWLSLMMAAGLAALTPQASAVLLPLDGSWMPPVVEKSDGKGGFHFEETWEIHSPDAPVELCISDIYVSGDTFEVFIGDTLLGSVLGYDPRYDGNDYAPDFAKAKELGSFSYACWLLDPGTHSITIRTTRKPDAYSDEAGAVTLSALARPRTPDPVPEGGSALVFLATSLAGLFGLRRLKTSPRDRR